MQGLGGMRPGLSAGATMSGNKGGTNDGSYGVKLMRTAGGSTVSATFTVPSAGLYQVAIWGGGANGNGVGAGGLAIRTLRLRKDELIPYVIASWDGVGTASTVTFSDGVMTANSATGGSGVGASGGDINLTGANGGGGSGGAAPSYGGLTGGANSSTPGGGGILATNPGAGMIIVTKLGD